MAKNPLTTKTLGPLHFEDLEPKRFEDLIRGLIADFRDWYRIEGIGRSGNDEGFDIRAWERKVKSSNEDEEGEEAELVLEGNLWQVQCKREKAIGPSKLEEHIKESFQGDNFPDGYILAAPADFSKDSRDKFRELMVANGIKEFFLWGKSDLEDMLFQQKNGRLLFTFFGISLNLERKSKITDVKYLTNSKNKLVSAFGVTSGVATEMEKAVVIRDINDVTYPYIKDEKNVEIPEKMWRTDIAIQLHPRGLSLNTGKYYAYIDYDKKEYDYFKAWDLRHFQDIPHDLQQRFENTEDFLDFWETIPFKQRGQIEFNSLLAYQDILHVDRYGDRWYPMPHLFIEKPDGEKIFRKQIVHDGQYDISDYKRISYFPEVLPKHVFGNVHLNKFLKPQFIQLGHNDRDLNLYFCPKGELEDVKVKDVLGLEGQIQQNGIEKMYEVIDMRKEKISDIITIGGYGMDKKMETVLSRKPKKNEGIRVLELRVIYKWRLEREGLIPNPSETLKESVANKIEEFPGLNDGDL